MTATAEDRRDQFEKDVAALKSKTGGSGRADARARIGGLVLMVVGVIASFVVYLASLSLDDPRNIASYQILASALLAVTVIGGALYLAGAVSRVLRLWLLRQLYENRRDES
ncbi:hypothetical protein [Rhodococcus sp. HNM0569]|uniref:hypothetical protein n=1 Tax=Rhodococcus sp. HNM0569 TaxID=2716340 RepID=UPI00146EC313|nr:hypothetical protein [Rhodococcus sp. HNM0569]NLU84158.1 hypothetical protein [Rhodococcus sp. HNM0569]